MSYLLTFKGDIISFLLLGGFKNMRKLLKIKNSVKEKLTVLSGSILSTFIILNNRVFAESNTGSIDSFINFACDWLTKIRRGNRSCRAKLCLL